MTRTVLLVDDVADLRYLLRIVLEADGAFEVVGEAGDGQSAVELAQRTTPDAIVLDLSMPTMDGLEALPRLRECAPDARIVVLSGFERRRLAASTSELGADAYFEKGTPPATVLDKLKELLGVEESESRPAESPGARRIGDAELHALIAHDLRSPLTTIVGFGQTLEDRWRELDDDQRRSLVGSMTRQARALQAVTDNLLTARIIDLQEAAVALEAVAPSSLLTELAPTLAPLCGSHPLELQVAPDLPVVLVDRARITQLLGNLIVNAEGHAPAETPIGLVARADGPWVAVEVTDRGPGIPYEDRVRVLEKYVRLDREGRGLGLGLFIASWSARAMGGSLAIADHEGGGLRVVCRLQVADPA